jgi:hypothetical protein
MPGTNKLQPCLFPGVNIRRSARANYRELVEKFVQKNQATVALGAPESV